MCSVLVSLVVIPSSECVPDSSSFPPERSSVLSAKARLAPSSRSSIPSTVRFPARLKVPMLPISSLPFAPTLPPLRLRVPPLTSMLLFVRFKLPSVIFPVEVSLSSRFLPSGINVVKLTAASLLRVKSLSSSRSVPVNVRVPSVFVKLEPTARVVFCKLIVAPLTQSPFSKLNFPPVEVIVVPVVISTVSSEMKLRSAVCVASVPGGDPEDV